jgi:hypothetical protein
VSVLGILIRKTRTTTVSTPRHRRRQYHAAIAARDCQRVDRCTTDDSSQRELPRRPVAGDPDGQRLRDIRRQDEGTGKTVTVIGIYLSGSDRATTAWPTRPQRRTRASRPVVTLSATGQNKIYDRTRRRRCIVGQRIAATCSPTLCNCHVCETRSGHGQDGERERDSISGTDAATTRSIARHRRRRTSRSVR